MTSVFVMAAGKGTRLAPWTSVVPKPALPVANEPALGFLLRHVAHHGYRRVVANASWLGDVLTGIFDDGSSYGVELTWSIEDAPLGTAGGVLAACDQLLDGDAPIVVLSGDGVHDVDLSAVVRAHVERDAIVTMALQPVADASQYGVAVLDEDGTVTGFQEKPARGTERSRLANAGIYVLHPDALELCAGWGMTDFGSELLPRLVEERRRVHGHALEGAYWNDIGDLDEWRATNAALLSGHLRLGGWGAADDVEDVLVHPAARIGDGVEMTGPCVVGDGAVIGDGCVLRSAMVLPHAEVPAGMCVASGTVGTVAGLERWARDLAT